MSEAAREKPEKEKEPPGPAPEVAPRDDVRVVDSKHRCPYCHEGVDGNDPTGVACGACLARHHGECWDERRACSTCGSMRRLVADQRTLPTDDLLVALLAKDRPAALAALRERGLDEKQAAMVAELVARALRSESPGAALGWTFGAQSLLLLVAAGAALAAAGAAVIAGLVALLVGVMGLAVAIGREVRPPVKARLGLGILIELGAAALAPVVIDATDVGPGQPSAGLFALALMMCLATFLLAIVTRRRD